MKTTTNEMKLAKRAELYKTISIRRLSLMFVTTTEEAQRILDKAVKKGIVKYERVNGRVQLQPTKLTAEVL
jgi:hypothetical protein